MANDYVPSPPQISLRTLLTAFVMFALLLTLAKVGGGEVLWATCLMAVGMGGAISLLGSNKAGATPLIIIAAAVTGATAATILGVYITGFDLAAWKNRFEEGYPKSPIEFYDLFWCGFWGALLSASLAAALRWLGNRPGSSMAKHMP